MANNKKTAIIIGAGIAGLSAAIRMANKGFFVIVFDANDDVGGKLAEKNMNGFRFDCGPSLFTMPQLFEELFTECGKNLSDYLHYQKLETITHYFFEDGIRFDSFSNSEKFAESLVELGLSTSDEIKNYLLKSKANYELTNHVFLEKSLHKLSSYTNSKTLKSLLQLYKLPLVGSVNSFNESKFKHPHLVQYFNRFATYNGSNPYIAPALLSLIPHLEHNIGAYYPTGGMFSIAKALKSLAIDLSVKFVLNSKVSSIKIENEKAVGVVVNDLLHKADYVFSNMDIYHTYKKLLPDIKMPKRVATEEKSSSGIVFFWGINKEFPELGLHNILFSNDYKTEFEKIFVEKTIGDDPTIYINITSKYTKHDAPNGNENWFVMINVPHNNGTQSWNELIADARKSIINKINRVLKTDIEKLIIVEDVLDPILIEANTSSFGGSLYGSASNSKWAAFLRHKNFSSDISNLFFCGGSVHPGGGIPLAMLSGKIAVDCAIQKL